jgi:hypothetical protein
VVFVVVPFPVGDDGSGFVNVVEGIVVQEFSAEAIVEGFDESVAAGLTGWV